MIFAQIVTGYAAAAFGLTGGGAVLGKSWHDRFVGLGLLTCAAGLGWATRNLAQQKGVQDVA
jgi:hypothetical protein